MRKVFVGQHGNAKQDPRVTSINALVNRYKQSARKRKLLWELDVEQASVLFGLPCHYCGCPPGGRFNAYVSKAGSYRSSNEARCDEAWFTYNGIDRLDNERGYVYGNVVPACSECNFAKHRMTVKQFEDWIARLVEYRTRGT